MLQSILQSIETAIAALLANKIRSFLTMLGIIIGVAAVIIIMAVGAGAQNLIVSQIETLGTDLIGVLPGHSEDENPFSSMMGFSVTTLTHDDYLALRNKRNVPNLIEVVAYSKGFGTAQWRSESYDTSLNGVTAGYITVEGGELESGRFLNEEEEKNLSRVAVLGSAVKNQLFGQSEAVGQRIKIENFAFEVIGVTKERGVVAMQDYDDQILIPLKTMQRMNGVSHIGLIRAKIDSEENIGRVTKDIKAVLRERHDIRDPSGKKDDFTVRNSLEALDMFKAITDPLKYFLAAMAAVSLVVGGIGIMNIMLISVAERTREVGLRKAVGANNSKILIQFLIESIAITLFGGLIGILLGSFIAFGISIGAHLLEYDWDFIVPISAIFLAVLVSSGVGLIFGLYPAIKASKLDPIEALRCE